MMENLSIFKPKVLWESLVEVSILLNLGIERRMDQVVQHLRKKIVWIHPSMGWLSINFDGSYKGNLVPLRVIGMMRDHMRRFKIIMDETLGY